MLRILQVINIMDRAGLETTLMNYYRNLDRTRIQFDFLSHRSEEGAYDNEILSLGGKIYHAPRLYPQNYINYFVFMNRFFNNHPEYRIIHSHIDTMSAFPLLAAKINNLPIRIAHSHTSGLDKDIKIFIKYFARLAVPYTANYYCACGEKAGKFLFGRKEFKVIPNAIDLKKFRFDRNVREKKRKEMGITNDLVIGHVGRYCSVKNQNFLINIFMEILKRHNESKLLLIGKGEDEYLLREKVKSLNIVDKVLFLVDRTDVSELYQAMDVFVMPSLFEGLPVVGIEAQASGLPCIFSDKISNEILLSNEVRMISLSTAASEWAKLTLQIANRRDEAAEKSLSEKGYDIAKEAKNIIEWYENLL